MLAGSPTHNNTVLPLVAAQLTYMKGLRPKNRVGALSAPTAGRANPPSTSTSSSKAWAWEMPAAPVKCNWAPGHEALKACHDLGKTVGEALKRKCQGE